MLSRACLFVNSFSCNMIVPLWLLRDFLPRGSGIVTRRPLVLQLVNHDTGVLITNTQTFRLVHHVETVVLQKCPFSIFSMYENLHVDHTWPLFLQCGDIIYIPVVLSHSPFKRVHYSWHLMNSAVYSGCMLWYFCYLGQCVTFYIVH